MAAASRNGDQGNVERVAAEENPMGSMNMEDLLNDIYSNAGGDAPETAVDEVWKEIVAGKEPEMTLEVFLTKAGAVAPDDVVIPATVPPLPQQFQGYVVEMGEFGNGINRKEAEDAVAVDKVTEQRQRRMIKNRESAARSRERKQAYTVELEALVMQLEEENAGLVREEAQRSRKRFKKLMENLIPVGENQRPPMRAHRRVHSVG